MKERESWIDSWKGILIFLVVLGHVAGMMHHFTTGEARAAMRYVYRFIYLFHMPAFFLLAGVLSGLKFNVQGSRADANAANLGGGNAILRSDGVLAVEHHGHAGQRTTARTPSLRSVLREIVRLAAFRSDASPIRSFVWRKFQRLLVPYFFWGVVSVVIFLATMSVTARMCGGATDGHYDSRMFDFPWWRPFLSLLHAGFWPNGGGFRCNSVLWFLPCMFCVLLARKLLQHLTTRTLNSSKTQTFFLAFCLLVLGGVLRLYVGPLPWCLDRVPRFLAFVYFGELIASLPTPKRLNIQTSKLLPLGWAMFAVGVIYFPDLAAPYSSWVWYFAEAGMALLGGALSMVLARLVDCRRLAGLGAASLGIMLVHKFPVMLVQSFVGRFGSLEVWEVGGWVVGVTVAVTVVSWLVTAWLRRWMPWSIGDAV